MFGQSDAAQAALGEDAQDTTFFRTARIGFAGTGYEVFYFTAEFDLAARSGFGTALKDVFVGVRELPVLGAVQVGHFKEPFSIEELTSSRFITFMERSLANAFGYVNKDNPLPGLTLPQVDAVFSRTRNGGYPRDIRTWGDVGLTGAWANQPIRMYGRNAASGTYGFFRENALFHGDYKDAVTEQPGSSAVVQACASDRHGIGYSGIGYRTADVRGR